MLNISNSSFSFDLNDMNKNNAMPKLNIMPFKVSQELLEINHLISLDTQNRLNRF